MSRDTALQTAFPASADVPVTVEPRTRVALQCQDCNTVYGINEWRGPDALRASSPGVRTHPRDPGVTWTVSHGICDGCDAKRERRANHQDHSEHPERDPELLRTNLQEVGGL